MVEIRSRPHVLMITMAFPGHFAPFVQLIYQMRRFQNFTLTVIGNGKRIAELSELQQRGDFEGMDLHLESVFGEPPVYKADPKFPVRAALSSDANRIEFASVKERLIERKNDVGAPSCIVADMFLWWTKDLADELSIPWYVLYSTGPWFGVFCLEGPRLHKEGLNPETWPDSSEKVPIPGVGFGEIRDIPHEVLQFHEFYALVSDRSLKASGILVNCAEEMAVGTGSLDHIRDLVQQRAQADDGKVTKVLPFGPSVQFPGFGVLYGLKDSPSECLRWLDKQPERNVLYIAFGSLGNVSQGVMSTLALGLEESGVPFLWVLKVPPHLLESVLPPGFLERVKDRAYIETGWAPQSRILKHRATGAFLTHCGWNSTLESLCAGIPMITWPLCADQPFNARFIVDVKKVGVAVTNGADDSKVDKDRIARAVRCLMIEEEGQRIRKNSLELANALAATVAEGGTTQRNLQIFFNDTLKA